MAPLKMFNMSLEEMKALASLEGSGVVVKEDVDVVLQIHPMYSTDIQKGVAHELDIMSSRYSKTLGGIPLGYEKVRVSPTGGIMHTSPYIHLRVWAKFYLFSPVIGMSLEAIVRKKSLHHISCLVHNMINVSVPRPQDLSVADWEGSHVEEGGKIDVCLTNIDMAFHLPMITGKIERVHDSQETNSKLVDTSLSKEKVNSRIIFRDSGISSDEELGMKSNKKKENLFEEVEGIKTSNNDDDAEQWFGEGGVLVNDNNDSSANDSSQVTKKKKSMDRTMRQEYGDADNKNIKKTKKKEKSNKGLINDSDTYCQITEKDKKKKQKTSRESSTALLDDQVPGSEKSKMHQKMKMKKSSLKDFLENPCSISDSSETEEMPKKKEKESVETAPCNEAKNTMKRKDYCYYDLPDISDSSAESNTETQLEKKKAKKKKRKSVEKNTVESLTIKSEPVSPVNKKRKADDDDLADAQMKRKKKKKN